MKNLTQTEQRPEYASYRGDPQSLELAGACGANR